MPYSGGRNCSVPLCFNCSVKSKACGVTFHRFPKSKTQIKVWQCKIKSGKTPSKWARICSVHFNDEDFLHRPAGERRRLKENAIPSRKLPMSISPRKKVTRRSERYTNRSARRSLKEPSHSVPKVAELNDTQLEIIPEDVGIISEMTNDVADFVNLLLLADTASNTYQGRTNVPDNSGVGQSSQTSVGIQTNLQTSVCNHRLSSNSINGDEFKSLIGICKELFLSLVTEVMMLENHSQVSDTLMACQDRVFLTLMKIKLGLSYDALAALFKISSRCVSNYFKRTVCALSEVLKKVIIWPDRENLRLNIPRCFHDFADTRVVLDCTEIPCEKPNSLHDRMVTYSHYKGGHTIKILIMVAPSGMITAVSEAWGGKVSDKQITLESGVIQKCDPHIDAIMVDKGFLIENECAEHGIKLYRPPFLRKQSQFTKEDSIKNQKIARARVHVERSIQRLKIFKILNERFDLDLIPYCNEIISVVCGLVNLSKPILADNKF